MVKDSEVRGRVLLKHNKVRAVQDDAPTQAQAVAELYIHVTIHFKICKINDYIYYLPTLHTIPLLYWPTIYM